MSITKPKTAQRGFTLIELLIVLGIFVLMAGLLLANYRKFNNSLDASNLAYDVALSVREAQTYGLAVQNVGNEFRIGREKIPYGVHFDLTTPTSYLIFADSVSLNEKYDPAPSDEVVKRYTLGNGYTVSAICVASNCNTGATALDILFLRPNPDARSFIFNGGGSIAAVGSESAPYRDVLIKIRSADGTKEKAIRVLKSGQISVQDVP